MSTQMNSMHVFIFNRVVTNMRPIILHTATLYWVQIIKTYKFVYNKEVK